MWSWLQDFGPLLLVWIAIQIVFDVVFCHPWEWERRIGRVLHRRVRRTPRAEVVPLRRPIEQLGADVRRLRDAFGRDGMRFAKYEGSTPQAYDGALTEAADALELTHFLASLPPGVDRDLERARIERLLEDAGLLPPLHAA